MIILSNLILTTSLVEQFMEERLGFAANLNNIFKIRQGNGAFAFVSVPQLLIVCWWQQWTYKKSTTGFFDVL